MPPEINSEMLRMLYEALGAGVAKLLIRVFAFFGVMMALMVMLGKAIELANAITPLAPYAGDIATLFVAIFFVALLMVVVIIALQWLPSFRRDTERDKRADERMLRMEQDIALIKKHLGITEGDDIQREDSTHG